MAGRVYPRRMSELKTVEMPAALIAAAGVALFGENWQAPLARALDIDERRMRYWAKAARDGEAQRFPRGLVAEIVRLLEARPAILSQAAAALTARL